MVLEPPPQPPPNQVEPKSKWLSSAIEAINSSASFVALAATEWLPSLIDQPTTPPFQYNASFENESERVARLLVIVIIFSAIIVGSLSLTFDNVATLGIITLSMKVIAVAFLIAIVYQPIAYLFGVRVSQGKKLSLRQIFFSTLYTFVPWLPIFAFLWIAIIPAKGTILILLLLAPWFCCLYIIYNFAKAIKIITNCSWYRIWASLLLPILLILLFIFIR